MYLMANNRFIELNDALRIREENRKMWISEKIFNELQTILRGKKIEERRYRVDATGNKILTNVIEKDVNISISDLISLLNVTRPELFKKFDITAVENIVKVFEAYNKFRIEQDKNTANTVEQDIEFQKNFIKTLKSEL